MKREVNEFSDSYSGKCVDDCLLGFLDVSEVLLLGHGNGTNDGDTRHL
jgi:hypothetical protein